MPCSCSASKKRTYFALIELRTEVKDGLLGGSAPSPGAVKQVTVCTECGLAEFQIPDEERRWYG
jgi:hypothetical protein